jgi:O-antigen ligase
MNKNHDGATQRQWFTLDRGVLLSIFLFFALAFNIKHSASIILIGLLFLSMSQQVSRFKKSLPWNFNQTAIQLLIVFSLLPVVIGLQVLCFPSVTIKQLDAASRFIASGLLLLLLLTSIDYRELSFSCYGCVLGTLGMVCWGWLSTHNIAYAFHPNLERGSNNFINPIEFGSFSITLGAICLILPLPEKASKKLHALLVILKVMGFIFGLMATIYSGSRAAFAALPLLLVLVFFYKKKWSIIKSTGIIFFTGLISISILMQTRIVKRVYEGFQDITNYSITQDTSVGARFQMWRVAQRAFFDHPIIGIGRGNYGKLLESGVYQTTVAEFLLGFRHAHNEYLNAAAEMGLLGLISTLLLLIFPALFFYKSYQSSSSITAFAAASGLIIVGGHAIFCLFDALFLMSCQTTFYSFSVVLFMAIILNEKTSQRISSLPRLMTETSL